jgi:hypothetical protein
MLPLYENTLKLIKRAFSNIREYFEAVGMDLNQTEMWKSRVLNFATDYVWKKSGQC